MDFLSVLKANHIEYRYLATLHKLHMSSYNSYNERIQSMMRVSVIFIDGAKISVEQVECVY